MKCSKCGYLGFESADRCRNCGYEFSLAQSFVLPDLPMRQDAAPAGAAGVDDGLDDFVLVDAAIAPRAAAVSSTLAYDLGRVMGASRAPASGRSPSFLSPRSPMSSMSSPSSSSTAAAAAIVEPDDLLLFGSPVEDDIPLITKPSPPRPPLSVRRATPEVPRLRTSSPVPRSTSLDLGFELAAPAAAPPRVVPSERAASHEWSASGEAGNAGDASNVDEAGEAAGVSRRVLASVVDSAILLAIDVAVIYLTMQICGVTIQEFGLLPKGPLIAFLVVQNVGYLVAFTVGGQTLGKMATGIKVVTADPDDSLDVACALKRTVAWLVLAVPGGLGLLSTLFSHDHRGLHDRFAGTRVVRASA